MPDYWLHVNHPNDKARIHVADGCAPVRKAIERFRAGLPYGPERGDANGYWHGSFPTLQEAEIRQRQTGKATQDRCKLGRCRDHFTRIAALTVSAQN